MDNVLLMLTPFAVFAVSFILLHTDGAFDVFYKIRVALGYYDDTKDNVLVNLLRCFWCFSTWVALFFAVMFFVWHAAYVFLVIWFAPVGIANLVNIYRGE